MQHIKSVIVEDLPQEYAKYKLHRIVHERIMAELSPVSRGKAEPLDTFLLCISLAKKHGWISVFPEVPKKKSPFPRRKKVQKRYLSPMDMLRHFILD
jgi:hypothetical protein